MNRSKVSFLFSEEIGAHEGGGWIQAGGGLEEHITAEAVRGG